MGGSAPSYSQVSGPSAKIGAYKGQPVSVDAWGGVQNGDNPSLFKSPAQVTLDTINGKGTTTGAFDIPGNAVDRFSHSDTANNITGQGSGGPAETPMPGTPGLNSTADPMTGLDPYGTMTPETLASQGKLNVNGMKGGLQTDTAALQAYQKYALDPNASPWLQMQHTQNANMRGQAEDAAVKNAATSQQQAGDFAASHGGLTGGGAARSAQLAQLGEVNGMQGARFNESNQNLNAGMFEEQQKLGAQAALPGMQENLAKYNAGNEMFDANAQNNASAMNAGNYIAGINQGNQNTLTKYGIDAQTAAAQNMANAMQKAGKHK